MTTLTAEQIATAWTAVAAERAKICPLTWQTWTDLPARQVTATRVLAALAAALPAERPEVLAQAALAAWRIIDDPSTIVSVVELDIQDDAAEARATHARDVASQWEALAARLQEIAAGEIAPASTPIPAAAPEAPVAAATSPLRAIAEASAAHPSGMAPARGEASRG